MGLRNRLKRKRTFGNFSITIKPETLVLPGNLFRTFTSFRCSQLIDGLSVQNFANTDKRHGPRHRTVYSMNFSGGSHEPI